MPERTLVLLNFVPPRLVNAQALAISRSSKGFLQELEGRPASADGERRLIGGVEAMRPGCRRCHQGAWMMG
jgi:hypothetical protein